MATRRRLVRPTGPLADRKREEDELVELIAETHAAAANLARRILDAGYRRVVVDDAMVERAAEAMYYAAVWRDGEDEDQPLGWDQMPEVFMDLVRRKARAALTAALDRTGR